MNGVKGFVGKNSIVNLVLVLATERRLLEEHLVDQNTKCPPVDGSSVLLIQQNLFSIRSENYPNTDCRNNASYIPLAP